VDGRFEPFTAIQEEVRLSEFFPHIRKIKAILSKDFTFFVACVALIGGCLQ